MALSKVAASQRARLAYLSRHHEQDDQQVVEARRDFTATRLADHIAEVIAQAPPLTNEQRERIAGLLISDRPQARHADLGLADDTDTAGGEVG